MDCLWVKELLQGQTESWMGRRFVSAKSPAVTSNRSSVSDVSSELCIVSCSGSLLQEWHHRCGSSVYWFSNTALHHHIIIKDSYFPVSYLTLKIVSFRAIKKIRRNRLDITFLYFKPTFGLKKRIKSSWVFHGTLRGILSNVDPHHPSNKRVFLKQTHCSIQTNTTRHFYPTGCESAEHPSAVKCHQSHIPCPLFTVDLFIFLISTWYCSIPFSLYCTVFLFILNSVLSCFIVYVYICIAAPYLNHLEIFYCISYIS